MLVDHLEPEKIELVPTWRGAAQVAAAAGLVGLLLFSMFLAASGVVLVVWSTQPDAFGFQDTFRLMGIVCLFIGLPLTVVAVWHLRKLITPHRGHRPVA
jgi:hypothetical protein